MNFQLWCDMTNLVLNWKGWICLNWIKLRVQSLTRVSLSRNSRGEMTQSFLAGAGEMNFRVSFSFRFSRVLGKISLSPLVSWDFYLEIPFLLSIVKIFEKNFSFSSQFSRFLRKNSLSLLDSQDIGEKFLLLLSIGKILEPYFSFSSRLLTTFTFIPISNWFQTSF